MDTERVDELSPIMKMTVELVSAYVQKNPVPMSEFPGLIESVHTKLTSLNQAAAVEPILSVEKPKPAVPIKKSVTPDYIISLEDGRRYKSLKRYLQVKFGMSPDDYRQKWGLPADYPMVAANYAAARSALAKRTGLGRRSKSDAEPAPAKKTGRKAKA